MNVILICLDTYRADCVAASGRNGFIQTPNLDRLVREGVLFDNAFGEGHPTIQYRRALCTGMRSFPFDRDYDTVGLWPVAPGWHKIPPEQPTMAEILLENGYATGLCADTYHIFKPTQNFTRGMASWDFIRGQETDNWRSGPMSAIDPARYTPPDTAPHVMVVQYLLNMQDRRGEMDWLPAKVFSSAIRFVKDNKDNKPFFLWIDSFDPHEPWDPPTKYADLYAPDWNEGWEPIAHIGANPGDKTIRRHRALYYGECTFVDKQIGRLLDTLQESGLLEETLILVTSDHGTELMDHGSFSKGAHKCYHRHNNEILCIMRFPDKQYAGKRIEGFVMNQDFLPTIFGQLGVKHGPVDGVDFMPLVRGEKDSVRDTVITGWAGGASGIAASVRSHAFAYSCDYTNVKNLNEHLFDLKADPGEMKNLAASRPDVVAEYRARLEAFLGEKLPGKPRHKLWQTQSPCSIWFEKAAWAQEMKKGAV